MAQQHPVKPVPVFWEPAFWDMSEYQAPPYAPSNALGLAPATAGRGGEPFGLSSPQPGRAVAAAPGRPAAVVPVFFASRGGLLGIIGWDVLLNVAGWGGTGDPRLRDPHKANRFAGTP